MTIQAAPVVCIMIGFILPVIFNAVIESHGLAVSYYRSVTFYMTVCVIMLTLLDMWIGSVPTRILYVLFSTVLCCAIAYGAGKFHFFFISSSCSVTMFLLSATATTQDLVY